jgi:hypothetical protein
MGVPLAELVAESAPQVAPAHPVPDKVQATLGVAEGSFVTVAVKFCLPLTATDAVLGETDTAMGGAAATVIVAVAVLVPSVAEVAVNVTVAGVGTVAGAV